jgi:hypothetical protein
MQTQQTITLFGTVSNSATSRISKNGRKYTAFGVAIISDRNLQAFHYNVVAFGKQGHFAKPLQKGTRIKLVVQAQSQPDNIATLPLLTATFVRPVHPVARGKSSLVCNMRSEEVGHYLPRRISPLVRIPEGRGVGAMVSISISKCEADVKDNRDASHLAATFEWLFSGQRG